MGVLWSAILTMATLLIALLLCFIISYTLFHLHKRRVHFEHYGLPKPQDPSLLWGDLPTLIKHWDRLGWDYNCGSYDSLYSWLFALPTRINSDYAFELVAKELGDPPLFMMDITPTAWHPICIVRSPDIAEAFTKATQSHPYSSEKAYTVSLPSTIMGELSIITAEVCHNS